MFSFWGSVQQFSPHGIPVWLHFAVFFYLYLIILICTDKQCANVLHISSPCYWFSGKRDVMVDEMVGDHWSLLRLWHTLILAPSVFETGPSALPHQFQLRRPRQQPFPRPLWYATSEWPLGIPTFALLWKKVPVFSQLLTSHVGQADEIHDCSATVPAELLQTPEIQIQSILCHPLPPLSANFFRHATENAGEFTFAGSSEAQSSLLLSQFYNPVSISHKVRGMRAQRKR